MFHFDTPTHTSTEEKPANQKRSRQKSSERQNQGKELKKKTDKKKATKINCYKNDKEGTGPNDKVNHYSEIGRRRRASLPRTKDAVPSDQSTMTQFYDYDDDENAENLGGARINLSELKTGISSRGNDSEGARGSVDSFKKANLERHDEKVKKKRNKAAEIITEMCKTTTRLRQKSDTDVKSLAKRNEPENWFEDGTAMESENVPAISDKPKKSSIDNHLTENITVMETEIKQGLTNTTANPVTIQYKTRGKSKKKTSEDQNSVTDADLTTAEQTDLQTKRPRSKKSRSLSSGKINVKDTDARVEQFDKTKKECNKSTPVKEVASAPKSGPRTQSKMHSERKSATPKSLKSKSAQQSSVLKAASSPRTPLLTNNKSTPLRARVSGSPAGLSPRTTLSPSNRSTPQRSKVSDVPAALSPALNKRNAKGETPLQVAAIKVIITLNIFIFVAINFHILPMVSHFGNFIFFVNLSCLVNYTSSIYAKRYIVFAFPFILSSICMFVFPSRSRNLHENFTLNFSKWLYLSNHSSESIHILFGPWVPLRVCFPSISSGPRVHVPGWGWR